MADLVKDALRCAVVDALTTICGRCDGKGRESWQVSRNPADGREDWPCNRCHGKGTVTDEPAVERVIAAVSPNAASADEG